MLNAFCIAPLWECNAELTNRGYVNCETFQFEDLLVG